MLLIKIGSGNELRHWPAGQPFAWLFACSPDPCWLMQSHSFPDCKGHNPENSLCQGPFPTDSGDSSYRETRGDAKPTALWKPHIYFRNNCVLLCPRDILATCFSVTKDCIKYCSFLAYTILKGFGFVGFGGFFLLYFIWASSFSEFRESFTSLLSVYYSYCS